MKKLWFIVALVFALTLAFCAGALGEEVVAAPEVEAAEELGELDLFAPEVYAGEPPEAALGAQKAGDEAADAPEDNPSYIKVDSYHFPDAAFRAYVSDEIDANGDGWLTDAEREAVTEIAVNRRGIASLAGLEQFPNLATLSCGFNGLKELYVNDNPKLVNLNCDGNALTEIDLSGNASLELLNISGNILDELDLSANKKLGTLYADGNDIVAIDISACAKLQAWAKRERYQEDDTVSWGEGAGDDFTARLTIDKTTRLTANGKVLYAPAVVEIDAASFPAADFRDYVLGKIDKNGDGWLDGEEIAAVKTITLRSAADYYRGVGALDCPTLKGIEYFTELEVLVCPGCGIGELDLSENEALTLLDCFANDLAELDVSYNGELQRLWCFSNHLTALDVRNNRKLESLSCFSNQLTALDVTGNPLLEALYCSANGLKALNVRKNPALENLECADNALTALDVRKNPLLQTLNCEGNGIAKLDVTRNAKLTELRCGENSIKKLNVSKCPALKALYCQDNVITRLALNANGKLELLECDDNKLKKLDVSKNPNLTELLCQGNNIKKLDIAKCPKLVKLVGQVKRRTSGDAVLWQKEAGRYALGIPRVTTLTNGKKVLYQGK